MQMHYLVVAGQSWGKGKTLKEAKRQLMEQTEDKPTAIYEVPEDYFIDEYGQAYGSAKAKLISGKESRS